MLKLVTILLLVAAACNGAPSKALARPLPRGRSLLDGRIAGGEPVDISQYPWQVSLQLLDEHNCGASIISSEWVLSAAHCIQPYSLNELSIRAGSSIRESGGSVYDLSNGHYHSRFGLYGKDYDIGVLQISGSFSFGQNVQAVGLGSSELPDGSAVSVSGWGALHFGGDLASQLHAVTVYIVPRSECNDHYDGIISENMICAGFNWSGKDACGGDSGGPLVSGNVQYGIVSFGRTCAVAYYPGVYSNVVSFRSWISDVTGV